MGSSFLTPASSQSAVRICCGPRCGSEPGHRSIYTAVERMATTAKLTAMPTLCCSECGQGVTIILPDGSVKKVSSISAAKTLTL